MRRGRGWAALAAPALVVALAAGCGGRTDSESSSDSATQAPSAAPEDGDVAADEAASAGGESALAIDTRAVAAAREIVRTGSMQLSVDDAEDGAAAVARIAGDAGGFVADEQARVRDHEVDITVRVPADTFEDVRGEIAGLGDVVEQTVEAQDVTAEVVDLDSRITSLERSVERLRGLLSEAGDVGQLAMVEGELARRETELEALQGQQRVLADQVALGTLDVHLSEDEAITLSEDTPSFMDGLRSGLVAIVYGGRIALTGLGFALPFLVPAALAFGVYRWLRRRATPAEQP